MIQKSIIDKIQENAIWTIRRYKNPEDRKKGVIYSDQEALRLFGTKQITQIKGNILLNEGINALFTIICSAGGTDWDNTNARLGVGDSSVAESATQTGLQGTSKTFKGMDATYPQYGTSQKATWRATFGSGEGNHSWQEFTVVNAADDTGDNLNRKVSDQGTKTSGQEWELTLEISLS